MMGDVKEAEAMTVPKKEQNAGVALLLERMKTHSEEFAVGDKWTGLLQKYSVFLNEEDQRAISEKLNEIMQQKFTEKVLEELVGSKESNLKQLLKAKMENNGNVSGTITVGRLHNYT